ncbi:hypothetical protein C8R43DRAFT_1049451 [Mycena crocata]|nr:hypothetical protein C8R43DRAFT_1049451 [Mycena crocata]
MYHSILLLLTAASLATAMPVASLVPRDPGAAGIPDGTTHLSYNDQTGQITAYNGASILRQYNASDPAHQPDRRDDATGSCVPVSEAEVQALKGWSKLEAAADSAWGKGSRKVVTNPPDYTWGPANACTDGETKVQFDSSKPSCDVQKSTQKAKWDKASGVATVSITNGIDQETSYTVTSRFFCPWSLS